MVLIVSHGINWEKNEEKMRFFWHKIPAVDSAIHMVAPQYFIIINFFLPWSNWDII